MNFLFELFFAIVWTVIGWLTIWLIGVTYELKRWLAITIIVVSGAVIVVTLLLSSLIAVKLMELPINPSGGAIVAGFIIGFTAGDWFEMGRQFAKKHIKGESPK